MTSIERLGKAEGEIGGLNLGQSMTLGAVGIVFPFNRASFDCPPAISFSCGILALSA
jgi:hypothetical protein